MTSYVLSIVEDDGASREIDVTPQVQGLIGAVENYYDSWIATMHDGHDEPVRAEDGTVTWVRTPQSAEDALESWTSNYGRAECEEAGWEAAAAFVTTIGVEIPDPYDVDEELVPEEEPG